MYTGTLTMHFRDARGGMKALHEETWSNESPEVVALSAAFNCNGALKDQSVASTFRLSDHEGVALLWVSILAPRFYRRVR